MSDVDLNAALRQLAAEWKALAQKADQQGRQLSVSNIQQAFYKRGLAEGLKRAQVAVQKLLDTKVETPTTQTEPEEFVPRHREAVLSLLMRSGLKIHQLHMHNDNSYSLILPTLQSMVYDEEMAQLAAAPNVIILAHGKLPNSTKAYIDFAFRKPPPS